MRFCGQCGSPVTETAKFCTNCGARLREFEAASAEANVTEANAADVNTAEVDPVEANTIETNVSENVTVGTAGAAQAAPQYPPQPEGQPVYGSEAQATASQATLYSGQQEAQSVYRTEVQSAPHPAAQAPDNSQTVVAEPANTKKGEISVLSILAFVFSFIIPIVGLILGIIDLCMSDGRKKGLSIAAVVISAIALVVFIVGVVMPMSFIWEIHSTL